jgi:hypothetical protein
MVGAQVDFDMEFLDVGYDTGEDRLLLWLPMIVKHVINDDSPLRHWRTPEGLEKDASSTIAVEVCRTHLLCCLCLPVSVFGGFPRFFMVADNHICCTDIGSCVGTQSVMRNFAA